jgi:predicted amidohydrolase
MDAAVGQPQENLARARAGVHEAGQRGSELVVLPELWYDGLDYAHASKAATSLNEGAFAQMRRLARDAHVAVAGSAFERAGDACYNTLAIFTPEGGMLGAYRKVHLFRPMNEDRYLRAGDGLVVVEFLWGKVGLAICYDLRFPELFRRHTQAGAGLFILPAQWPWARLAHWRALTQARAIENQVYVAGCNRAGLDGDVAFGGHSVIYDPWGERLLEAGLEPALLTVGIDLEVLPTIRRRLPVWEDRRPDLYG